MNRTYSPSEHGRPVRAHASPRNPAGPATLQRPTNRVWLLALLLFSFVPPGAPAAQPDRTAIAIEALTRLKGTDLEASPELKNALLKVLELTRGTPQFVELVRDFRVTGQQAGLLEVATRHPADPSGIDAARLLLAANDHTLLSGALSASDPAAATRTAEVLGNTADKRAVSLLLPVLTDPARDPAVRKQAVRSLARTREGCAELLALAKKEALPADVRFTASTELNTVRWDDLKSQAAALLPLPQGRNAQPLPPLAELLKLNGDVPRGEQVFFREETQCAKCHQVGDRGTGFGPALTEIGTKLGKDALYEAILDPSAGISFDYEAWEIVTRRGDEHAGIVVSESPSELTLKNAQAVVLRLNKADIARRQKMKLSIMPAGLQLTMSQQDLVDLVEYLSRLRTKP
jgi:putative heme-binding domain-containing protein